MCLNTATIASSVNLRNEFEDLTNSKIIHDLGYTIKLKEDDLYEWDITLLGAPDSSYADGIFHIRLSFPKEYPDERPNLYFLTPIYHLNVNPRIPRRSNYEGAETLGFVSVTFINWWKPSNTVKEILIKLYSIFYWESSDSPYNLDRVCEYRENKPLYELKVKYFTKKYATKEKFGNEIIDKDWNFSVDEKNIKIANQKINEKKEDEGKEEENKYINLKLEINGQKQSTVKCEKNELTGKVIEEWKNNLGIKPDEDSLFIFNRRKLINDIPLKDNGLKDNSEVIIIYDVLFA